MPPALSGKAARSPQVRPSKAPKVPKKGGAGGKGTWGVPGDEMLYDEADVDEADPNFDPVDPDAEEMPFKLDAMQPRLEGSQLKQVIDTTLKTYLKEGDEKEAALTMDGVTQRLYMHYIVSKLIRTGLPDRLDAVSALLLYLSSPAVDLLNTEALEEGFRDVFDAIDELELDAPGAGSALKDLVKALEEVDRLSSDFLPEQLELDSRLNTLKEGLKDTLTELFVSHDTAEFVGVTLRTECPAFHPLVVKHLLRMAVEKNDLGKEAGSKALTALCGGDGPITQLQCMRGLAKLLRETEDITLDAPNAEDAITKFIARAVVDECVPPSFLENVHIFSIGEGDAGVRVVAKARALLDQPNAAKAMTAIWVKADEDKAE